MSSPRLGDRPDRDPPTVAVWRRRCLERAGVPSALAADLARDTGYDLHALLELLERGCAPELAARILAPLDRDRADLR